MSKTVLSLRVISTSIGVVSDIVSFLFLGGVDKYDDRLRFGQLFPKCVDVALLRATGQERGVARARGKTRRLFVFPCVPTTYSDLRARGKMKGFAVFSNE